MVPRNHFNVLHISLSSIFPLFFHYKQFFLQKPNHINSCIIITFFNSYLFLSFSNVSLFLAIPQFHTFFMHNILVHFFVCLLSFIGSNSSAAFLNFRLSLITFRFWYLQGGDSICRPPVWCFALSFPSSRLKSDLSDWCKKGKRA